MNCFYPGYQAPVLVIRILKLGRRPERRGTLRPITFLQTVLGRFYENCFKLLLFFKRLQHFLGPVTYHVSGFLEKNKDSVTWEVSQAMYGARHPLLPTLFPEGHPARGGGKRPATTAAQFRLSLCALVRTLAAKHPHYIRCLRPNDSKQPRAFDVNLIKHQVICLG